MANSELVAGQTFGAAVAKHFGLKDLLKVKLNVERDEVLSLTLDIGVTAADLSAIADLMSGGLLEVERKVMAAVSAARHDA